MSMGHILIMGRKTFESIGKQLDGRLVIVVTSKGLSSPLNVIQARSIEDSLLIAKENAYKWNSEILIAGGGEIFRQTIDLVQKVHLTVIPDTVDGDIFYPIETLAKNFILEKSLFLKTASNVNLNIRTFYKKGYNI